MRQTMLTNEQLLHLEQEKTALSEVYQRLSRFDLPPEALETLRKAINQLDELFLVVVVGEFNSGKSALINALLGQRVLAEGVTPTTAQVTLVRWGEQLSTRVVDESFAIVTFPLPLLKELNLVDSPGTNAIIRQHERLTNEFVPRSDLVLFVTSSDRPLTESERQFLEKILAWGKKVTLVINKSDILENDAAVEEVRSFVLTHTTGILGNTPTLFVTSAKLAQKAAKIEDPAEQASLRSTSGLDALEEYITETLNDSVKLDLKFRNPLGVAENLLRQAEQAHQTRNEELQEDAQLVQKLESTISNYEKELQAEVPPRLAEVEGILQKFEMRGQEFFDNTLRVINIANLTKSEKIKARFEQEVMADMPQDIDGKVHNLINWLVDKDLNVWYQIMAALDRRQAPGASLPMDTDLSPQTLRRKELAESVGQTIRSIINDYDRKKEAEELRNLVEGAVSQTALFEVGAVGLGALVATALFSSAMDVTGIVAASTLAILGLFVIPYKRKQAKQNFKEKMEQLRANLMSTLNNTFSREFSIAVRRLQDKIAPFTTAVQEEQNRLEQDAQMLDAIKSTLKETQDHIQSVL